MKIGPLLHREIAAALVVDLGADHVGGQQIGRELDAVELRVDGAGEGPHRQRLGQTRHPLEQHVPIGQEPDDEALEHGPLSHDHLAELGHQITDDATFLGDELGGWHTRTGAGIGRESVRKSRHGWGI